MITHPKRDFYNFDEYLQELLLDIYPQPEKDDCHPTWTLEMLNDWVSAIAVESVLDVGCGEAFAQDMFTERGVRYTGVCVGKDFSQARKKGRNVYEMDFSFLDFEDGEFDLIFSRHSLEHSPMPLVTLMEWHRVADKYLALVLPNPEHYTYVGRNHYSVADVSQVRFWLERSGWEELGFEETEHELRFLCKKVERKIPFYE